ncbi:MAG: 30S ribosomal protein S1 [Flavobacteriales bacterium]|nr:30S ribosomal protein S1 [Flavobacteriales bacterium]MBL6869188.1 30S ribosomal protein S1 [Flavobacteriales bacterium]
MAEDKKEPKAAKKTAATTKKTTAKKAPAAKKTTAKKETVAKKAPAAKKTTAKKETVAKKAPTTKKTTAKKEISITEKATSKSIEDVVETKTVAPKVEKKVPTVFDWDAFEAEETDSYSAAERTRLNDMYDGTLTQIEEKSLIQGLVIAITKKEVVININYKSEGVVPKNEFRYNPDLAIGDSVDLYIENMEDKTGQLVVSHKTARTHLAWIRVNEVLGSGEIITGYVKCRTKGGLIVDVFGIEAFLPGSQIDVKPIRDYDQFVGKNMEFKVVKINKEFKNVVVSHKALIEAEIEEQKKQIMSGLEKGQVLEGIVKNITSYGVFIDLGGVDGLIHITDLSWGRVNHPEELVTLDEKIKVVILDFDDNKKRIALGLKQLSEHPWDSLNKDLKIGDKVKGNVVVIADYGAFIEIAPGVEGLVHVSEMSWSQHLRTANDFLKVSDEVEAVVLTLDKEERKMSLGIKQLIPDPWENIDKKYPIESKHISKVRNFTNFGVFVELEEGIDGLIHISDLSWDKKFKHPSEFCNVGDELEVVVLELDAENRRLSLGHKQLQENHWDVYETVFTMNSSHEGTVIKLKDKAGIVSMEYGIEAYCPAKHMKKEDGSYVAEEEKTQFVVLEFNKESKKILVSHTKVWGEVEAKKAKSNASKTSRAVRSINDSREKTTLGDLEALSALKDKMDKGK